MGAPFVRDWTTSGIAADGEVSRSERPAHPALRRHSVAQDLQLGGEEEGPPGTAMRRRAPSRPRTCAPWGSRALLHPAGAYGGNDAQMGSGIRKRSDV